MREMLLAAGLAVLPVGCGIASGAPIEEPAEAPIDTPGDASREEGRPPVGRLPVTAQGVLQHVRDLPHDRHPGSAGHDATRAELVRRLEGFGESVRQLDFAWAGLPGERLTNLEVRLPADRPSAPLILVGAHWDAVPGSPGADDNGSGVAVVLELVRRLAGRLLPAEVRLILFDAEESGLAGSREYARSLSADELERCLGMIDLETVGYTDRSPDSQAMPLGSRALHDPGTVGDFVLVLGNQASRELASTVGLALALEDPGVMRAEIFTELPGTGWLMPDSRRSDHASFWDVGVPAVMLTDTANFRNPHYHRPSDSVETLDGAFLAAVARGVERAILLLAEGDAD